MISTSKKYKFILKFKIESNIKSLNPKISTVLSQKRINSSDFLIFLKEKLSLLNIKEDVNVQLRVLLFFFELDDYLIYIKMPSLTSLLNRFFFLKKNYCCPGFLYKRSIDKYFFNYIITPYILYEILFYQFSYDNTDDILLIHHFKKNVDSLKSKGINICYSF